MLKEAETYAENDKLIRNTINARQSIENYLYEIQNTLNNEEFKNKVTPENKELLFNLIEEYFKWYNDKKYTLDEYLTKRKEIEHNIMPILKETYTTK
jgi:molecular chaperone DnaK (HSP70)